MICFRGSSSRGSVERDSLYSCLDRLGTNENQKKLKIASFALSSSKGCSELLHLTATRKTNLKAVFFSPFTRCFQACAPSESWTFFWLAVRARLPSPGGIAQVMISVVMSVFCGLNVGVTVRVAHFWRAGRKVEMKNAAMTFKLGYPILSTNCSGNVGSFFLPR